MMTREQRRMAGAFLFGFFGTAVIAILAALLEMIA